MFGIHREMYNSALSSIAKEVEMMDVDYTYLIHLFLSDNEEFISHLQEGKTIISRSSESDIWKTENEQ
ncbi:MAG: hypothetical protein KAU48_12830 [Candidatus Thorarchaeota archaeon]|nr:hypothetical protein [Candidatus Thorarchaeota archaeon]